MRKILSFWFTFAVLLCAAVLPAASQEIVHALTGTVSGINPMAKSITFLQDNGDPEIFAIGASVKTKIPLDKRFSAEAASAEAVDKQGAYVILFYAGGNTRAAVALKSLGKGPFTAVTGTVKALDKRSVTVEEGSGDTATFRLDPQTVGESTFGVVEAMKLPLQKGAKVRIVASQTDGTALFVRVM